MIPYKRNIPDMPLPDLTPILDTVFILLFFFVIAATFAIHGVDLKLPQSSSARTYSGQPMEIYLKKDGSLSHNGQVVTLRDLTFLVKANVGEKGKNRQILLLPDREASVGDFMLAVGAIRDNGGDRLVIAAKPQAKTATSGSFNPQGALLD